MVGKDICIYFPEKKLVTKHSSHFIMALSLQCHRFTNQHVHSSWGHGHTNKARHSCTDLSQHGWSVSLPHCGIPAPEEEFTLHLFHGSPAFSYHDHEIPDFKPVHMVIPSAHPEGVSSGRYGSFTSTALQSLTEVVERCPPSAWENMRPHLFCVRLGDGQLCALAREATGRLRRAAYYTGVLEQMLLHAEGGDSGGPHV